MNTVIKNILILVFIGLLSGCNLGSSPSYANDKHNNSTEWSSCISGLCQNPINNSLNVNHTTTSIVFEAPATYTINLNNIAVFENDELLPEGMLIHQIDIKNPSQVIYQLSVSLKPHARYEVVYSGISSVSSIIPDFRFKFTTN